MVEERMMALDDYTIVSPLLGKMVWLDASFIMTGLHKEGYLMQEAWQAPRYIVEACGEDLADLIRRAVVFRRIPAPLETSPIALASVLAGENESWRVYCVKFLKDAGRIYFSLVLRVRQHGGERYQATEVGLGCFHVPEMTIKIVEEIDGRAAREVFYKRALSEDEAERRIVLAGWNPTIGSEVLRVRPKSGENIPTEASSRLTMYTPPEVCSGIEIEKL